MKTRPIFRGVVVGALAAVALTACSDGGSSTASGEMIVIEDNYGSQSVPAEPVRIIATDNSTFETLDTWGVELAGGAVTLMPDTISYSDNEEIVDLGSHREPNLEQVVAIDPDLIINGGRYAQFREDLQGYAPDAAIIEVDPRDGEPLDDELKRGVTVLGEVFDQQDEAAALVEAFDASIERVNAAYDGDTPVMGLIVSGGQIGYVTPGTGRAIGPMFDIFEFTPALEVEDGSNNHMGDDISVEAIAASNPGLIIVLDRDAGTSTADTADFVPAASVIEDSQALQNVEAIQTGNVIYMPADTYTNESIQTYTEFFNSLADLLEQQNN